MESQKILILLLFKLTASFNWALKRTLAHFWKDVPKRLDAISVIYGDNKKLFTIISQLKVVSLPNYQFFSLFPFSNNMFTTRKIMYATSWTKYGVFTY